MGNKLDHTRLAVIIVGIVLGMRKLHSMDIIHGNLLPSNILLNDDFEPVICGLDHAHDMRLDETMKEGIGTIGYMAPEMIEGNHYDRRVDIFSFGVILYELLFRESAFDRKLSPAQIYAKCTSNNRPQVCRFINVVAKQDTLILLDQCWSASPDARPRSFDEIYRKLESIKFRIFDDVDVRRVADFAKGK